VATSFASYPQNAAVYDNAVDDVKQGKANVYSITSVPDIKNFIKIQETGSSRTQDRWYVYRDVYDSTTGQYVPAIGYGSDLQIRDTGSWNLVFKKIVNAFLKQNPQLGFTINDYYNQDSGAYIDQATADAIFNAGYQVAEDYVNTNYSGITLSQKAALIDIVYNIGKGGMDGFSSMNADIAKGTPFGFACAGLELINSKRTTQIGRSRTLADFYLLTSAPGVADQL
jgi:GH24 family phage-related lysozyme (muramidase)